MIQSTLLTKRTLKDTQNCLSIGKGAQGQSRRYNCSPKGWGHLSSRSFLGQCPDFKGRDSNCRPIARRKTNSKWGLWQPPFITLGWNLTCDQILSVVHKLLSTKVFIDQGTCQPTTGPCLFCSPMRGVTVQGLLRKDGAVYCTCHRNPHLLVDLKYLFRIRRGDEMVNQKHSQRQFRSWQTGTSMSCYKYLILQDVSLQVDHGLCKQLYISSCTSMYFLLCDCLGCVIWTTNLWPGQ